MKSLRNWSRSLQKTGILWICSLVLSDDPLNVMFCLDLSFARFTWSYRGKVLGHRRCPVLSPLLHNRRTVLWMSTACSPRHAPSTSKKMLYLPNTKVTSSMSLSARTVSADTSAEQPRGCLHASDSMCRYFSCQRIRVHALTGRLMGDLERFIKRRIWF